MPIDMDPNKVVNIRVELIDHNNLEQLCMYLEDAMNDGVIDSFDVDVIIATNIVNNKLYMLYANGTYKEVSDVH